MEFINNHYDHKECSNCTEKKHNLYTIGPRLWCEHCLEDMVAALKVVAGFGEVDVNSDHHFVEYNADHCKMVQDDLSDKSREHSNSISVSRKRQKARYHSNNMVYCYGCKAHTNADDMLGKGNQLYCNICVVPEPEFVELEPYEPSDEQDEQGYIEPDFMANFDK